MSTPNTHFGVSKIGELLGNCRKIFFIGIGGVSMSSLAQMTALRGFSVAGSDRSVSPITEKLEKSGITVCYGHSAENVADADAVVYTVAIKPDNPEYLEAKRRNIPCISRADYLGYIMTAYRRRVGISGMHGKSTCTSMCAAIYLAANADPTVVSGADYPPMGGYYRIGRGESFIFEACEYMDSFLDFNPTVAVILNVEPEHLDYFGNLDRIVESYAAFAGLTGDNGTVIYNADDKNSARSVSGYKGRKLTFGFGKNADISADRLNCDGGLPSFDITENGKYVCHIDLKVPGVHNVYNALAATAVALCDGIRPEAIVNGLSGFTGAGRRMEYRGKLNGAAVYDDYGHHPTEIKATLTGARALCGNRRLVCAFQPHTYSRTAAFFDEFAEALKIADRVLLTPIYAARETDDLGVSSERLAEAIGNRCEVCSSVVDLANRLKSSVTADETVVVMGAGSIEDIFGILKTER